MPASRIEHQNTLARLMLSADSREEGEALVVAEMEMDPNFKAYIEQIRDVSISCANIADAVRQAPPRHQMN